MMQQERSIRSKAVSVRSKDRWLVSQSPKSSSSSSVSKRRERRVSIEVDIGSPVPVLLLSEAE